MGQEPDRIKKGVDLSAFSLWGGERLIDGEQAILAGISGGVDSMVLLELLLRLFTGRIVVCHVNHGLRGEESDGDEELVRGVAEEKGLRYLRAYGDVNAMAKNRGVSVELAARDFRRECFMRWSEECSANVLFLAHHANDQAETVLFNLCRGGGARGISPMRKYSENLTVIRPLLECKRSEIVEYARTHQIKWREDSTNAHPVAARNRLRLEVLPALEDVMQRSVVEKLSQAARLEESRILALREAIEGMNLLDPQGRLYLPKVLPLGGALRRTIVHWYLSIKEVSDISFELVEEVEGILRSNSSSKVNLPGNKFARRKEKRLIIE